jgi:hypothetical protein
MQFHGGNLRWWISCGCLQDKRATIDQIAKHPWLTAPLSSEREAVWQQVQQEQQLLEQEMAKWNFSRVSCTEILGMNYSSLVCASQGWVMSSGHLTLPDVAVTDNLWSSP